MSKTISECPSCGGKLNIAVLRCSACGMELHNEFQRSSFDSLTAEQTEFLISFLRQRGNMSSLQAELGISYPAAKKKLDDLLTALQLTGNTPQIGKNEVVIDMSNWSAPPNSTKPSDIIKRMLIEHNGRTIVHTAQGLPCEVQIAPDGVSFLSNKLPNFPYRYEVFDVIVDLLISQGGRARKGNGRNFKLGEPNCDETTVVGAIAYNYAHKEAGTSVFDPVFVLAAILEWAGIVSNERGELVLTAAYQEMLRSADKNGRQASVPDGLACGGTQK